jgi:5-methylcytosine-specific restriction endonuclease McrA
MTYELKDCMDCKAQFLGANRSQRCKPCQKEARRQRQNKLDKIYYQKNREKILKKHVEYQLIRRHKDIEYRLKQLLKGHTRRARIAASDGSFTSEQWEERQRVQCYSCFDCGEYKPLTIDHIIPLSKSGSNSIDNIQALCGSCNSRKKDKVWI